MKDQMMLLSIFNQKKLVISKLVLFLSLFLLLSGCAKQSPEINVDPVNTPFSLGPNDVPSVTTPSTNPPQ